MLMNILSIEIVDLQNKLCPIELLDEIVQGLVPYICRLKSVYFYKYKDVSNEISQFRSWQPSLLRKRANITIIELKY